MENTSLLDKIIQIEEAAVKIAEDLTVVFAGEEITINGSNGEPQPCVIEKFDPSETSNLYSFIAVLRSTDTGEELRKAIHYLPNEQEILRYVGSCFEEHGFDSDDLFSIGKDKERIDYMRADPVVIKLNEEFRTFLESKLALYEAREESDDGERMIIHEIRIKLIKALLKDGEVSSETVGIPMLNQVPNYLKSYVSTRASRTAELIKKYAEDGGEGIRQYEVVMPNDEIAAFVKKHGLHVRTDFNIPAEDPINGEFQFNVATDAGKVFALYYDESNEFGERVRIKSLVKQDTKSNEKKGWLRSKWKKLIGKKEKGVA